MGQELNETGGFAGFRQVILSLAMREGRPTGCPPRPPPASLPWSSMTLCRETIGPTL